MDVPTHDELIGRIDAFLDRHNMRESSFGREAMNNSAFVGGLRAGSSPTLETLNRLKAFMAEKDSEADLDDRAEAARSVDDGGCGAAVERDAA